MLLEEIRIDGVNRKIENGWNTGKYKEGITPFISHGKDELFICTIFIINFQAKNKTLYLTPCV